MFFLRNIGKLVLGKASAFQVLVASTIGAMLGFVPGVFLIGFRQGLSDAPALVFSLLVVVLVLNTNLAVFGLAFVLAKLGAVPMLPVNYEMGRLLLDGPTQPVFEWLINAPFFAWFGFARYATTGGLAVGFVLGLVLGFGLLTGLRSLHRGLASVEDGERYQRWSSKLWVRFMSWLLLGIRPQKEQWSNVLEQRRKGSPVRIWGIVAVVVLGAGLWFAQSFFAGPTLRTFTQGNLESWNGATVDLARAQVHLTGGRVSIAGLALADPNELERDSFRARSLDLAVGTGDLLRRRFVIDEISSRDASSGMRRDRPGKRIETEQPTPPEPPKEGKGKTLEDYIKDARKWKERLQQVSRVLRKFMGDGSTPDETEGDREEAEKAARQRARLLGLARATADHLIHRGPTLLVRKVAFDGVKVLGLGDDLVDIRASNLSTDPSLVDSPMALEIRSRSGKFSFSLSANPAESKSAASRFTLKGLPIDSLAKELTALPLSGGTLDLQFGGKLDFSRDGATWLDMPLSVTLHDTTLAMDGIAPTELDDIEVPLGLRGPLAAPRISVETDAFVQALIDRGKAELAKQVQHRVNTLIGDVVPGVGDKVSDLVSGKKSASDLLGEAKKQALDEAKKAAKSELEKLLPGSLFGRKRK